MSRITGKINLLNLYAQRKMMSAKSGQIECLIIPITKNRLYVGDKGVYLDLVGFEIEKPIEGNKDTHLLKQSFSKEIRDGMTEDELRSMPILGNLRVWDNNLSQEPLSSPAIQDEVDDLPF